MNTDERNAGRRGRKNANEGKNKRTTLGVNPILYPSFIQHV